MTKAKTPGITAVALLICGLATVPSSANAAEWQWALVPYVWGTAIGADVYVNDDPIIGADIGFDDILDKTDFAAQLHFEGQRGKAGFFMDVTYLNLGSSQTTSARPPLPGGTQVGSDLRTTLFEAAGFYRLSGDTHGLDLLFGARVIDLDLTVDFALPPPLTGTRRIATSETLTDGFAGLRYSTPFAERWMFTGRADVGAGDSDLSWSASAYLGYAVGKQRRNLILFGYRHLALEFKGTTGGGQRVETDMTMSGPAAGFAFRF
jgi:hypothetical protein